VNLLQLSNSTLVVDIAARQIWFFSDKTELKLDEARFLHIPHVATYYSDLLGLISHTKEVIRCVGRPFFRCLCHEIDGTTLARSMCIEIIFCVLCHLWQIRYSNILHDIIQHFGCFIFGLHFYKIFHKLVPGYATW